MRTLLALVAGMLLVAAAPQARDWRATVGTTPGGGFTVGNPAAKIALVEYLSFTCPHCAQFAAASKAQLHDGWVRTGAIRVETRALARDPFDLAAWVVARCGGPRRFAALSGAIFAEQDAWLRKGDGWVQANLTQLRAMPQLQQIRTVADQSGLAAIGARHGVTPATLTACTSRANIDAIVKMTEASMAKIHGTPSFEINGALDDSIHDWAGLEPRLRAAGAR